jgi:hypothetical protein
MLLVEVSGFNFYLEDNFESIDDFLSDEWLLPK